MVKCAKLMVRIWLGEIGVASHMPPSPVAFSRCSIVVVSVVSESQVSYVFSDRDRFARIHLAHQRGRSRGGGVVQVVGDGPDAEWR